MTKTTDMVELDYFHIDRALGGSQDWMPDPWMKLGGCAALAAVDSFIYFTLFRKKKNLCPVDVHRLTKSLYIRFAMIMKPYIPPRFHGVSKLELYTAGVGNYLKDRGCTELLMKRFPMGCPAPEAEAVLKRQMDQGNLVPVLLLEPISREWQEYHWHWFLLIGYRQEDKGLMVKAVTYGEGEWLSFAGLWDEARPENGGMILYEWRQMIS